MWPQALLWENRTKMEMSGSLQTVGSSRATVPSAPNPGPRPRSPPPHYLPLPHPGRVCGHIQGELRSRGRERAGPQNIMEENQALPLEPGSSSSDAARSKMSHRIPGGGTWGGWRVQVVTQSGWGEARCRASSPSWTLAPRSPKLWSL